ncbi:rod shape-determining protein MreC [Blattabacterium cuenoti]|uniref:rod shape-determining protein MreC n=1 Tax=Blattabacterium cuenoti TaxID=1653831 RepID=UPI00163CA109|nr:rod shape-determining protein MreC [Blattabacterium cuenoti]
MREFFNLISKIRFFIFFFLLECIAIFFTFSDSKFNQDIYYGSSYLIIGKLYETISKFRSYFLLEIENEKLLNENKNLRNKNIFSKIEKVYKDLKKEDINYLQQYIFTPVKVVNNSIHEQENYITINKGRIDGICVDMGIILSDGIAGIIVKTTPNFSIAISILNPKIKVNARLKKNKCFGALSWDGIDYKYVILNDIPRYCNISKGDIIETDGKSSTFPEGIAIGKVYSYKLDEENANFIIKVKLFSNFSTIEHAYVVKNLFKKEWENVHKVEYK